MGFSEKQVQFKIVGDGYEKMPPDFDPRERNRLKGRSPHALPAVPW